MLGDDISKGTATKILESNETLFTSLGALFMAAADRGNAAENITSIIEKSIWDTTINRLILERICLHKFSPGSLLVNSEKLKDICIDTNPDEPVALESVQKYGSAIKFASRLYKYTCAIGVVIRTSPYVMLYAAGADPAETGKALTQRAAESVADITRLYSGMRRFNKLAKGEWAIVTTPKNQEYIEKEIFEPQAEPGFT